MNEATASVDAPVAPLVAVEEILTAEVAKDKPADDAPVLDAIKPAVPEPEKPAAPEPEVKPVEIT